MLGNGDNETFVSDFVSVLVKVLSATFTIQVRRHTFFFTSCGNAFFIGQFVPCGDNEIFVSRFNAVFVKVFAATLAMEVSGKTVMLTGGGNFCNQVAVVVAAADEIETDRRIGPGQLAVSHVDVTITV